MWYVSNCWVGKTHDYGILKEEFPPEHDWFASKHIRVDLGFMGMAKDYRCTNVSIPHKRPKGGELSSVEKATNTLLSQERIYVEHSIGGMKRYRIRTFASVIVL